VSTYDDWKTSPPKEREWVCPECGRPYDDIPEATIYGLGSRWLFAGEQRGYDATTEKTYPRTEKQIRENAVPIVVLQCVCGWLGVEDGLIEAMEYHRPD